MRVSLFCSTLNQSTWVRAWHTLADPGFDLRRGEVDLVNGGSAGGGGGSTSGIVPTGRNKVDRDKELRISCLRDGLFQYHVLRSHLAAWPFEWCCGYNRDLQIRYRYLVCVPRDHQNLACYILNVKMIPFFTPWMKYYTCTCTILRHVTEKTQRKVWRKLHVVNVSLIVKNYKKVS